MGYSPIGVMQGRLSSPENGRFQSFPRNSWREEIARARNAGLEYIEWIYDDYGSSANPILTDAGVDELNLLKSDSSIATPAICGDWLMDFPLIRCTDQERTHREDVLPYSAPSSKENRGHAWSSLPFVDNSSIRTEEEKSIVVSVLERALPVSENEGVEMHLEADFDPHSFATFLFRIPHPMVKVN